MTFKHVCILQRQSSKTGWHLIYVIPVTHMSKPVTLNRFDDFKLIYKFLANSQVNKTDFIDVILMKE